MKIAYTWLIGVVMILVAACGKSGMENTSTNGAADDTNSVMSEELFDKLMEIWEKDAPGDGYSACYENGEIILREDKRDTPELTENYEKGYLLRVEGSGWSACVRVQDYSILEKGTGDPIQCGENLQWMGEGRFYAVEPVAAETDDAIYDIERPPYLKDITSAHKESSDMLTHYNNGALYKGFVDVNGTFMACYIRFCHDEFGHAYKLTAAGTGNLLELKHDAGELASTFTVSFDIDEWLEQNGAAGSSYQDPRNDIAVIKDWFPSIEGIESVVWEEESLGNSNPRVPGRTDYHACGLFRITKEQAAIYENGYEGEPG